MYYLSRARTALISVAAVTLLGACATKKVNTRTELPPKSERMRGDHQLAVVKFEGARQLGLDATRRVKKAISNSTHHTLVTDKSERRMRALNEKLARGGGVGKVGSAGPDLIVSGKVRGPSYEKTVETSERNECVEENADGECTKQVEITQYHLEETCRVDVTSKATSVDKGSVVFQKTLSGKDFSSTYKDNEVPDTNRRELCENAYVESVTAVIPWLTSVEKRVNLKFRKVKNSKGNSKAIEAAETNNFEKAQAILEDSLGASGLERKDSSWIRYNLGLVYFARGSYAKCVEQVDMAARQLSGKNKVTELRTRCNRYAD
jgi:hypothetical protein